MLTAVAKNRDKNELTQVWNFKGKYADFMRELLKEGDSYKAIFDEIYHGYAFCAMYGMLKGRRHKYDSSVDNPNDSQPLGFRWAYADGPGIYSYDNLRKMVLLYSKSSDIPFDRKIDLALRFDYTTNDVSDPILLEKSQYKNNSDFLDEYVLGGLELLHEKVLDVSSREQMIVCLNDIIQEMQTAVKNKRKLLELDEGKSE